MSLEVKCKNSRISRELTLLFTDRNQRQPQRNKNRTRESLTRSRSNHNQDKNDSDQDADGYLNDENNGKYTYDWVGSLKVSI